ncbi:MAG TPA: protein kinase [Thermoanaerobaculia bacterium]|nr:protein kinase [Thermoanaerobaculia bacterium]
MNALEGGSSVGRYRIVSFLGAGAMGEVYLAEDPQIDRRLAIKTVRLIGRPQEIDDRKKRLLREARAAGRLLHPNIVTLFDAGEADGLLYLAFEYVEGTDLAHRLDSGAKLSLREALRFARQASEALDYAHSQGIVHRDIKPSNLLLDRVGRVKVADFGIAKMAGQSTELTMAGSVMGSPQYLSPEQIKGEDLDGRSDIFSLGVVLYEILSGKRPFEGDTITTLVYRILNQDPPPISDLRAVPPRLEALMRQMLAKDRNDRLAVAGEAARELAAIEMELTDETLSSSPAGAAALEETFILPRKPSTGATIPPPPPPWLSDVPPTRSTVPASPATTPSTARPPAPPAEQPMPAAPPPSAPPPPTQILPAAAVPMGPPPLPVHATSGPPPLPARPTSAKGPLIFVAVFALLMLAAVAAGGWYAYSHWMKPRLAQIAQSSQSSAPETSPVPPSEPVSSTPGPVASTPAPTPISPTSAPPIRTPGPKPSPRQTAAEPSPPMQGTTSTPPVPPPDTSHRPAVQPPGPSAERPRDRVPVPAPAPAPAAPAEEEEAEPVAPAAQAADRTVRSGLNVAFRVTPPDAFVLVDGKVIGQAQDWNGQKEGRTYSFAGPGTYLVKVRKDGMKELKIAVEASASAGTTPIYVNLRERPAEQVDAGELRTVRVREAVAFRVRPPLAEVLVDGKPMGPARLYAGGRFHPKEWLELPQGKHRVSIVAPGHRRQDVLVEVAPTAENDRERIDVDLRQGGDGG